MQQEFIDDELLEYIWVTAEEYGSAQIQNLCTRNLIRSLLEMVLSEMVEKKLITIR